MEQTFFSTHFERDITISIADRDVEFLFGNYWDDISFYDFTLDEWESKFKEHMSRKRWFTPEMAEFINKYIQPC